MIQVQKTNTTVTTSVTAKCNCGEDHFIEISNVIFDVNNNVCEINDARVIDAGYNQLANFNAQFTGDKIYINLNLEHTSYVDILTCIMNTIESLRSGEYEITDDIIFPLTPEEYWAQQEALMNAENEETETTEEELVESEETTVIINAYEETETETATEE